MKIRLRLRQLLSGLFRRFAPSALICALFAAVCITQYAISLYAGDALQEAAETPLGYILAALGMGLFFATAASCLCGRYRLPGWAAWPAAAVGGGVGLLLAAGDFSGSLPVGIILCCLCLCLHSVSRKDAPAARLSQVCGWFCGSFGVSIVLYVALEVCSSALLDLLLPDASYDLSNLISFSLPCLIFMLFAPWLFLGGLPSEETPADKRAAFGKFTAFVLLPPYLLLLAILLIYVAKIAVTASMPVGVMNGYAIAALTLFVFFHLTLSGGENRLSAWFRKWGALLTLPVIAAQAVGVWMRVAAYGLTEARILGLIWTALCVAAVIHALFRRRAGWFFLAAAAASVLFLCTPLSAGHLAVMNQDSRLAAALSRSGMIGAEGEIIANPDAAETDRKNIYSAIDYLSDSSLHEGSVYARLSAQAEALAQEAGSSRYSPEIMVQLLGFEEPLDVDAEWYARYFRLNGSASTTELDVRGYDHAELITVTQWGDADAGSGEDTSASVEKEIVPDKDAEPQENRYGLADLKTLCWIIESARDAGQPVDVDIPVLFMIDGEMIDLAPLLDGMDPLAPSADLTTDTLTLSSGKTLRFTEIRITNYAQPNYEDTLSFTAWLLTPEAE